MKKHRTADTILGEIDAIRRKYHERHGEMTVNQIAEHNDKLVGLQQEFSDSIAAGAKACECGNDTYAPMGMLKTPARTERGVDYPAVYEVGCAHCPPVIVESENGYDAVIGGKKMKVVRRSVSARATTPEDAVKNWNNKKFVEDNLFDRNIPGVSEAAVQDENGVWQLG